LKEEYRRLVEKRILDLVANHPTVKAIQRGESVTDEQLLALERTLHKELEEGDLEVSPENIRKAFGGLKVESFLAFARQVLELEALPDYQEVVQRVPVRVKITDVPAGVVLRPGMSVDLSIDTKS